MPACTIPGCNGIYAAKGLCEKHYKRRQVHGDPLFEPPPRPSIPFDDLWTQGEPDECWLWRGLVDNRVSKYRGTSASRLVYTRLVGPIPEGKILQRTCFNHLCVNPGHMELVTRAVSRARRNRGI